MDSLVFYPDSFIINEQFNLHPFSSKSIPGNNISTLIYYQKKADSLRTASDSFKRELIRATDFTDSLEIIVKKALTEHEKTQWKNADNWKIKQIPDSALKKLDEVNQGLRILNEHSKSNEVAISLLNVEKAEIEYEIAKINLASSDFVLKNLTFFQDTFLANELRFLDSVYWIIKYDNIPDMELRNMAIEHKIESLKYDALESYSRRVSFFDFLLFSAANSSTVTYGDIIPNDMFVRVVLFIQALSSIALIALFMEVLIKKIGI